MSNPAMQEAIFQNETQYIDATNTMTINGTVLKAFFLLLLICLSGSTTWGLVMDGNVSLAKTLMYVGVGVGLVMALIIIFMKKTAPYLSPIYALAEGLALGGISAIYAAAFQGIVFQAVTATFAVMFAVLGLYLGRVIRVTDKLRSVIVIATAAIALMYVVTFILAIFGITLPYIHDASVISISISVFVIIIAAANFLLDFDVIERGVASYAPKHFEWYCAFGLMLTLVWLYVEFLKLLSKLQKK